ncbi:MAG: hypothetical protein U1A77_16710 [Pirellulales bacterium]
MNVRFTRAIRTSSSERYLVHIDGKGDDAVLELHYLDNGTVAGTLIVLDKKYASKEASAEILQEADRLLLPTASLDEGNMIFTVVKGQIVGEFKAAGE